MWRRSTRPAEPEIGLSARILLLGALLAASTCIRAQNAEYLTTESTAAESVAELESSLESIADDQEARRDGLWRFRNPGPFLRDSNISFKFRGYDFERTDGHGTALSQASALGGELRFQSGRWRDLLSVATSWYGSNGVDAPPDLDGTGLLGPGQSDISVLGRAFVQLNVGSFETRLYRQDFMLPYINRQDSRMVPNTHEAYGVLREGDKLGYLFGHISKIKTRTSDKFISMAEAAGVDGGSAGTSYGGLRYKLTDRLEIGGLVANTDDAFNIAYLETNWAHTLSENLAVKLSAQYTDQHSVGREQLGEFSTHTWGLRFGTSFRNASITIAYTNTDENAPIRSPFGGRPSYNSMMLFDFDRAGEQAHRIAVSYHFGRIGLPGVSIQTSIAEGRHAIDSLTGMALSPGDETDITIDFRPQQGKLEGLWIRFRKADANVEDASVDRNDTRLIINYDFAML